MPTKSYTFISHTHPADGRHLSFFANINKMSERYELKDELEIKIDILEKQPPERLDKLRRLFIEHYLIVLAALTTLEDKLCVLELYLEAFDKLLTELKAFYDEGIQEIATADRASSSYSSRDVKVDYWFNWDLRFVYKATHTFDSFPISVGLGILSSILILPFFIPSFLLKLMPLNRLFSHDGEDISDANLEDEKNKLLGALIKEKVIQPSERQDDVIHSRWLT